LAQSAAIQLSVINTLTSLGGNSSAPSIYDAAGLLSSFQQPTPGTTNIATSSTQAAQDAYLQVQYAISQTMASLVSGTSQDSSSQDIFSLVNPAGTSNTSGLFGSSSGTLLNGATSTTTAQAALYAAINAQYAISQTLGSLTSGSSSKSSTGA
jgi:hypothetical protein